MRGLTGSHNNSHHNNHILQPGTRALFSTGCSLLRVKSTLKIASENVCGAVNDSMIRPRKGPQARSHLGTQGNMHVSPNNTNLEIFFLAFSCGSPNLLRESSFISFAFVVLAHRLAAYIVVGSNEKI